MSQTSKQRKCSATKHNLHICKRSYLNDTKLTFDVSPLLYKLIRECSSNRPEVFASFTQDTCLANWLQDWWVMEYLPGPLFTGSMVEDRMPPLTLYYIASVDCIPGLLTPTALLPLFDWFPDAFLLFKKNIWFLSVRYSLYFRFLDSIILLLFSYWTLKNE